MNGEIERVLKCYPSMFRSLAIAATQPPAGFSGATVVRLRGECGEFCLRGWPVNSTDNLPRTRLLGLHELLRSISRAGVHQVSVPIDTIDGTTIVDQSGRTWQLEPWMPGNACFHDDPNDQRLAAAMKCLAAWHRAARSFQCPPVYARWFTSLQSAQSPACAERARSLKTWLSADLDRVSDGISGESHPEFRRIAPEIVALVRITGPRALRELEEAAGWKVPIQPCLRDVWHDHILFSSDTVTGLIDPNACRSETVATDLARLLGSLVGDQADRWSRALEVYASDRPIDSIEQRLTGVLDRSAVVLSGLTWLRRRYLLCRSFDLERVLTRLQTIATRLRFLASPV